jgi:glutathione S-transferase
MGDGDHLRLPPEKLMLELYNFPNSTCSQKVRLCLAEKGLEFIDRRVDWRKREQHSAEYLKLNPHGVVPTLMHDGQPIIESSVIVEYLDEMFPEPALAPRSAPGRAWMRAWLRYIDEVPTPAIRVPSLNMTLLAHFARLSEEDFAAWVSKSPLRKHFLQRMGRQGFSRQDYDNALEQLKSAARRMAEALRKGPWLLGSQFSLADICLVPTIDRLSDLGLASVWEPDFPEVSDWYARVSARPSFVTTYFQGTRLSEEFRIGAWNALLERSEEHQCS